MTSRNSNLTILCGFSTISGLEFRPDTIKKGKELTHHVFNVREVRREQKLTIDGQCIRSMSLKKSPYSVEFDLCPDTRKVLSARCSCVAGIDGKCKHTFALYNYVNTERISSCTDQAQGWQKPTEKLSKLYPKGETISELYCDEVPQQTCFLPEQDNVDFLTNMLKKHGLQKAALFKSLTVDKSKASEVENVVVLVNPAILQHLANPLLEVIHSSDNNNCTLTAPCQEFYTEKVMVSSSECITLFEKTLGQSQNPDWFLARKFRVTASVAHKIAKGRKKDTRKRYFFEDLMDNKCLQYGREMEPLARAAYENIFKKNVEDSGLVVCAEQPWLACTPDGLIVTDSNEVIVLEIKCPIRCRDDQIDVDYLKDGKLKKSHCYYTQVQLQLYLCRAKICHFFVYSSADHIMIEVEFDQDFI